MSGIGQIRAALTLRSATLRRHEEARHPKPKECGTFYPGVLLSHTLPSASTARGRRHPPSRDGSPVQARDPHRRSSSAYLPCVAPSSRQAGMASRRAKWTTRFPWKLSLPQQIPSPTARHLWPTFPHHAREFRQGVSFRCSAYLFTIGMTRVPQQRATGLVLGKSTWPFHLGEATVTARGNPIRAREPHSARALAQPMLGEQVH